MIRAALLLAVLAFPVRADPPPGADPLLAPWFESLTQPSTGAICCSMADGRPTMTRLHDGHLEAWVGSPTFRDAPDAWVEVPPEVVIHGARNPLGEDVVFWYAGRVRCFVPGSGT